MKKKFLTLSLILLIISLIFSGCAPKNDKVSNLPEDTKDIIYNNEDLTRDDIEEKLDEDGIYSNPKEVAEYIHLYSKLPPNFITKKEAMALGWDNEKGNLWDVTDKMSIGGDSFGNREGLLPKTEGRKYYECDVNYEGGYRGPERIVYSNDGLIYYTKDHYKSFEKLY